MVCLRFLLGLHLQEAFRVISCLRISKICSRSSSIISQSWSSISRKLLVGFKQERFITALSGCDSSIKLTSQKSKIAADELFASLRDVAGARNLMKQFKSVYVPGNHTHQASYKPLLKQVVEEIFNPERPDPVDIEHMSSGLTDLLKTGFSMFMKVSRPHPSDHPLLILFVVGGVTVSEAKMIKDLVPSLQPGTQVIVLSTRLLKPLNIPELLFATDRLHPDLGF
uniref:sec1 family domain-containing protein 2-like n=1 Tax=Halichoerus grypus TaxID=9711 RepID=UPI0016592435|nr:sec1 family domain-containing protein 2-like [Halichoerus grypus]